MLPPDLTRSMIRSVGRWFVALVAVLVATSFGVLEVAGARAYDQAGEDNVLQAASSEACGDTDEGGRDVPEERDDDEERDEERGDDERTDPVAMARASSALDATEHRLRGGPACARRSTGQAPGERGGHARMIDRPPHA